MAESATLPCMRHLLEYLSRTFENHHLAISLKTTFLMNCDCLTFSCYCETSKKDHLCKTSHRHGHTVLTRTVADGCERLRTVALANATSSEHTLNPQTPRVKREPLLRIREKRKQCRIHKHIDPWAPGLLNWAICMFIAVYHFLILLSGDANDPLPIQAISYQLQGWHRPSPLLTSTKVTKAVAGIAETVL